MGDSFNGHLLLFHGFQQSCLRLWRGSVDLVSEKNVGEQRTCTELEFSCLLVVHVGPHDVRWKQVRCKLNTLELAPKGTGEGVGKQRLGQSREVFEQHVAVGENTDGHSAQVLVLSDDDLADFIHQAVGNGRNRGN